jgi:carboxyl-terminal processing protease
VHRDCQTARPATEHGDRCFRERVQVAAVTTQTCNAVSSTVGAPPGAKLAFVRLSTFTKQTPALFVQQLRRLQSAGVGAIVLDLRNNGGGSFSAGVQVHLNIPCTLS